MHLFKQSEATAAKRDLFLYMLDSSDHVTLKTGLTLTVLIAKAGGTTFGAIAGTSAAVTSGGSGTGAYVIHLAAADLDTLGQACLLVTSTGADSRVITIEVQDFITEVHLTKARVCNKTTLTIATGVLVTKDDNGTTTLLTQTPTEATGVRTITPT